MKLGSTVTLTYRGTLEDGTEFGFADAEHPMEFQTGMDVVIPGLEREILAMEEVGEKKTFTIDMYDAYGEYIENNFQTISQQIIPRRMRVGQRVPMTNDDGEQFLATVVAVTDDSVKFDMNHPLAGKDLTFEVEILKIEDAPENFIPMAERLKMMEENQPSSVPFMEN